MKALKTIVATAVIVFALTTVAMAGARHVGTWDDAAVPTAGPAATETHQGAGVTPADGQFARLLHAVDGRPAKLHTTQADRDMSRDRDRDHSRQKANDSATHVQAQKRTQTHDSGGTHDHGTQSGSTHRSGTHEGGATHHDGGAHNSGTHYGGTHNGGTHHE